MKQENWMLTVNCHVSENKVQNNTKKNNVKHFYIYLSQFQNTANTWNNSTQNKRWKKKTLYIVDK